MNQCKMQLPRKDLNPEGEGAGGNDITLYYVISIINAGKVDTYIFQLENATRPLLLDTVL